MSFPKPPQHLGILVHQVSEKLLKNKPQYHLLGKLILHWPLIVGKECAEQSLPYKIVFSSQKLKEEDAYEKEGALYLYIKPDYLLTARYHLQNYLQLIHAYLGYKAFSRLVLKQKP